MPSPDIFGWDIGGAHVKACRSAGGEVIDVMQWACPLWQGIEHLDHVLHEAHARWPAMRQGTHAVTMTGEMVDLFEHREDGVRRIALQLESALAPAALRFFAGDAGWCDAALAATHWHHIASANWLATARHAAQVMAPGSGVLIDIGSTTTDLVAFRFGQVLTAARSDAERLATGELVYQGVVRTPLCALAQRVPWRGGMLNVMNEFFATTADVHRLTGELNPSHDLHPSADQAPKDVIATCRRLARMIGLDARDGSAQEWLDFARAWRKCQVEELGGQLQRVLALHGLGPEARIVSAGCGDFLVPALATRAGLDHGVAYGRQVARLAPAATNETGGAAFDAERAEWAQVCAPCIAVAALLEQESSRCGL